MTRIEKDFNISFGLYFNNKFMTNIYEISVAMMVETEILREQNIAMERLEYFFNEILSNSVCVESKYTDIIEKYTNAGIRVISLPEEPYDQIIGMIILLKCNAIMEQRLVVTDLNIGSKLSDHVRFSLISEVAENIFHGDFWWNNVGLNTIDIEKSNTKKVVKLFENEWTDLGLTWKDKKVTQNT